MRISDLIAEFIEATLREEGKAELQRSELASRFNCVPSQINYVITSRFTPEQGYIVESRRGSGGYIRITRANIGKDSFIMHVVNGVGDTIDQATAIRFLRNLCDNEIIGLKLAQPMAAAVSDRSYGDVPPEVRDALRAKLLKNMLVSLL